MHFTLRLLGSLCIAGTLFCQMGHTAQHHLPAGGPVLVTQAASGLHVAVYNAITNPVTAGPTTTAEKNAIMPLVAAAIAGNPANQAGRDGAIHAAVMANGGHLPLGAAIKAAVDAAHPIAAPQGAGGPPA